MPKPHEQYQSKNDLVKTQNAFLAKRPGVTHEMAIAATFELGRRFEMGYEDCPCCKGSGWLKDVGQWSSYDEMCDECNGIGSVLSSVELAPAV